MSGTNLDIIFCKGLNWVLTQFKKTEAFTIAISSVQNEVVEQSLGTSFTTKKMSTNPSNQMQKWNCEQKMLNKKIRPTMAPSITTLTNRLPYKILKSIQQRLRKKKKQN